MNIPKEIKKSWNYVKGAKHEIRETQAGHQFNYDEGAIPFPDNLNSPSRTMLTSEGSKNAEQISHIIKDPNNLESIGCLPLLSVRNLMDF